MSRDPRTDPRVGDVLTKECPQGTFRRVVKRIETRGHTIYVQFEVGSNHSVSTLELATWSASVADWDVEVRK